MEKITIKNVFFGAIASLIAVWLLVGAPGHAHSRHSESGHGRQVITHNFNGTLFTAGTNVRVTGTIDGDVFCAGQNITVAAEVKGDVICAGQNITVRGPVAGDIRIAAQNIDIESRIAGSATLAAETVALVEEAAIGRDATLSGTNVAVRGDIGRDMFVRSESAAVGGVIGRDITANSDSLRFASGSVVSGKVVYQSQHDATVENGAQLQGGITKTQAEQNQSGNQTNRWPAFVGLVLVSLLLLALLLAALLPGVFRRAGELATRKPGITALMGVIASLAVPIAIIMLLSTVIGIPIAILIFSAWVIALLVSGPLFGYLIGSWLLKNSRSVFLRTLLGSVIVLGLYTIPFINILTMLASHVMGTGMVVQLLTAGYQRSAQGTTPKASTGKKVSEKSHKEAS